MEFFHAQWVSTRSAIGVARARVWSRMWVGVRFSREVRVRCARVVREAGRGVGSREKTEVRK